MSEGRQYFVLGIEADAYRILNDSGNPYLYEPALFDVIDNREANDWITEFGEEGERYAYPPLLNVSGFFEDYFDRKPEQISIFWSVVNQHLARAA
ncbi:hypothetical protein [Thiospirillum jenense]|uniref:Uncharacterized protein n=1 Tax=Thiospirillum jenense TaxID=1653858 RepID=A0A839HHH7_9GAMM|nr:hypothetical protein [Thiospirillum jenense]MBB1126447.1 hypothetical protein [Thiospirillum jenense]